LHDAYREYSEIIPPANKSIYTVCSAITIIHVHIVIVVSVTCDNYCIIYVLAYYQWRH